MDMDSVKFKVSVEESLGEKTCFLEESQKIQIEQNKNTSASIDFSYFE